METAARTMRRRWFDFSLGARFWVVATAAVAMALLADQSVRILVQQQDAFETLVEPPAEYQRPTADLGEVRAAGRRIGALQTKKVPPGEGDWLNRAHVSGQSFDEYLAARPYRADVSLKTIYVQPVGKLNDAQQRIAEQTRRLLGHFFGMPAKMLPPLELDGVPEDALRRFSDGRDEQIMTRYLLEEVLPLHSPADAALMFGLTARDLTPADDWRYVFGQASMGGRTTIESLHRFGDPSADEAAYRLCLRRTLKVALHEAGHIFGLPHCAAYECGMNGSNNVDELDRNALGFCAECEQKRWWALRLPIRQRYRDLVKFARENELAEYEQVWQRLLDHLSP